MSRTGLKSIAQRMTRALMPTTTGGLAQGERSPAILVRLDGVNHRAVLALHQPALPDLRTPAVHWYDRLLRACLPRVFIDQLYGEFHCDERFTE
jgi:hypothetical protein